MSAVFTAIAAVGALLVAIIVNREALGDYFSTEVVTSTGKLWAMQLLFLAIGFMVGIGFAIYTDHRVSKSS